MSRKKPDEPFAATQGRTATILISANTSWNLYNFRPALIHALRQHGYRVVSAAPEDAYSARLRTMVDAHHPLPMDNAGTSPLRDLMLLVRYVRLLRAVRPAVMLTYTIKPNIYGALAARLCGVPVIANVSGLGTAFIREGWLTAIVKPLYRLAFGGAARVFFQNPEDRALFIGMKLVDPLKAGLLPGSGIDLDYFYPSHAPAVGPTEAVRFVLIARLLWDKGVGDYVAAARIVRAAYPNALFRLVGPKDIANRTAIPADVIEGWVREGVVEYRGETDAVRDVIAQHDCVVLPSYREGMSRVLLEAAAMGKPLIATDVPGCRQVVEHGRNGLLCTVRDAQGLAEAMIRFMNLSLDERAQMGAHSRSKAEQEFGQQRVLDAYSESIASLIG